MKNLNIQINVKVLKDRGSAKKIADFLTSTDAFDQTWAPSEKSFVRKAVFNSLNSFNHRYWYVELDGKIIGALGVNANKYDSGGYEMDSDYVAVHKDYRRYGIATKLLKEMEDFVIKRNARYIHILTCDIDSYKPALKFYRKNGYKKVAEIPDYYVEGEGRIDLIKNLN